LKSLEEDNSRSKKQKQSDNVSWIDCVILQHVESAENSVAYELNMMQLFVTPF
jgi:hypothetical protein